MSTEDQVCRICGTTDNAALERCTICAGHFCRECAHRAYGGRRFCSEGCARTYFFHEDEDADKDTRSDDG